MSFFSTLCKKTGQLAKGLGTGAWSAARAVAGGLTGVAFSLASVFDLEGLLFSKIKGTGFILPALTTFISGLVFAKKATQEVDPTLDAKRQKKLLNYLRSELQQSAESENPGCEEKKDSLLTLLLSRGNLSTQATEALDKLSAPVDLMEAPTDTKLTEEEAAALMLALADLYENDYSAWQKYSHALLFAAFDLVSPFSEGLQLSVFEGYTGFLFDFGNILSVGTILPAALTLFGLYHAYQTFNGVKASYEQPKPAELESFLTTLFHKAEKTAEESTPLLLSKHN